MVFLKNACKRISHYSGLLHASIQTVIAKELLGLHKNPYSHFTHCENLLKIDPLQRLAIEKLTSWKAFINSSSSFLLTIVSIA